MKHDEFERLKEAEKEHLRKVRALKAQLKDAHRQQGVAAALRAMDTSGLDDEFERSLREVEHQNVSSEARYELAVEALDEAAERERKRLELERFEAEQQKAAAAGLVEQMKAEMEGRQPGGAAESGPGEDSSTSTARDDAGPDARPHAKTIGRPRSRPE
jgi:hypothetical protein